MRTLAAAVGVFLLLTVQPAARRADEGIRGSVTVLGGSEAIADVDVTAFGPMEGKAGVAVTGSDGRFTFQNLSPGLYSILAKRQGYIGPATPGAAPTSPIVTATVTVGANEPAEVLLYMVAE